MTSTRDCLAGDIHGVASSKQSQRNDAHDETVK